MFDVSFFELLLIALVALIVLGPERLPKAARHVGLWVRRARAQWHAVRSELENELADEDMRRSLRATQEELRAAQAALREDAERLRAQMRDVEAQMTRPSGSLVGDIGAHARTVHDDDADVAADFHALPGVGGTPVPVDAGSDAPVDAADAPPQARDGR